MLDLILGVLAFVVLQGMLVVVYGQWTNSLNPVQTTTGSGAVPRDRRRLMAWMACALCLMVLEGFVYVGLLLRLQVLIQSAFDHTVETLFWFVITLAISIAALVDVAFCGGWILQIAKFLLEMMAWSPSGLRHSAVRNGTSISPDPENGNLRSAPHSPVDETSSLLGGTAEGQPDLSGPVASQNGDPKDQLLLAWVSRDEMMRKATERAARELASTARPTSTPGGPSTTQTTPPSTSSSGSDFGPCYVDSEFEDDEGSGSKSSSESSASAKSQPEFHRDLVSDEEEELTILYRTMTL